MNPGTLWRQHDTVRLLFSFFYSLFADYYYHRVRGPWRLAIPECRAFDISCPLQNAYTSCPLGQGLAMATPDVIMPSILDMSPPL